VQQIQATRTAFAAILADETVVTWGDPDGGGDSRRVKDQLQGVKQIQATSYAFAALLSDGTAITWGHSECGGTRPQRQVFGKSPPMSVPAKGT